MAELSGLKGVESHCVVVSKTPTPEVLLKSKAIIVRTTYVSAVWGFVDRVALALTSIFKLCQERPAWVQALPWGLILRSAH